MVGASQSADLTVKNEGAQPSGAIFATIMGPDYAIVSNRCTSPLAGGATCAITISFTPTTPGPKSATLQVTATPGGAPTAALTGTGMVPAELKFSANSKDFGVLGVGSSLTAAFTATNTGGVATGTITTALVGLDFLVSSNTCTTPLAPGGSCLLTVTFAPTALGNRSATLTLSATPGGSTSATLSGVGATATLRINPTSFSFGSVGISTPAATTFTVSNVGGLASGPLMAGLSGAADFTILSNGCGTSSLPAGGNCSVQVAFTPTSRSFIQGTLHLSATPGGAVNAALNGSGVNPAAFSASPTTLFFPFTVVSTGWSERTVTITNTGEVPSGTPIVQRIGMHPAQYSISASTCTVPLAPGASCAVTVRFSPQFVGGPLGAGLNISTNPGGAVIVALSGTSITAPVPIATWALTGSINSAVPFLVTSVEPNISASPLTATGLTAVGFAWAFMADNWPSGTAPDMGKYFEFSVSPAAGSSVVFDSVRFSLYNNYDGATSWVLRSSVDGFVSNLASGSHGMGIFGAGIHLTANLNVVGNGLGVRSNPTTFRFYTYGNSGCPTCGPLQRGFRGNPGGGTDLKVWGSVQ